MSLLVLQLPASLLGTETGLHSVIHEPVSPLSSTRVHRHSLHFYHIMRPTPLSWWTPLSKYKKYAADLWKATFKFQPVPVEALGGVSHEMQCLVKTIARRAAREIGCTYAQTASIIFRDMSMILAKGLANLAIARLVPRDDCVIDPQLYS